MKKLELEKLLKYHDNLYYNNDNPEITDEEYDSIKNRYIELYGEYNYVPGEAIKNTRYDHKYKILSLDKVQMENKDAVKKEIERLWPIVIQPKLDGLTLVVYEDAFVTRGNGSVGEIIPDSHIAKIDGIGINNFDMVRGEVVMPKAVFEKLNKERIENGEEPFKNARNAAAGMLRNKDASAINGLVFVAYNCEYGIDAFITNEDQINDLKTYEWNTVESFYPKSVDDAVRMIESMSRDMFAYDIDGIVIKHCGHETFGFTGHHPKDSVALKFPQEGIWTKLQSIKLQTGKTGRITPVAEFDPIDIMGSTVSRATLHNMGIVKALGLNKFGSKIEVKVIKANDIIPRIIDVRYDDPDALQEQSTDISTCPVCGGKVELVNDQHFCTNIETCEAQLLGRIVSLGKRDALDIVGLSEATAQKMINYYHNNDIKTVTELDFTLPLHFTLEDLKSLPGFAKKSAENLYKEIQKAKTSTTVDRFIYACSIPLIGRTASKEIAKKFDTIESLAYEITYNGLRNISEIEGFGPNMVNSIKKHSGLLSDLWDAGVKPIAKERKEVKKVEKQLTFVITGKFQDGDRLVTRDEIKTWIQEKGHKVAGSVSVKTDFLIINNLDSTTSKAVKARELGIKLIADLDELANIIN